MHRSAGLGDGSLGELLQGHLQASLLQQLRAQLSDESAQPIQLSLQQPAQRFELLFHRLIRPKCSFDDLDLETGVGDALGGTVVELLGDA